MKKVQEHTELSSLYFTLYHVFLQNHRGFRRKIFVGFRRKIFVGRFSLEMKDVFMHNMTEDTREDMDSAKSSG